jgi:hypothetical protein
MQLVTNESLVASQEGFCYMELLPVIAFNNILNSAGWYDSEFSCL